ncbi:MAG: hypothetical protein UDG94_01385 [Peptococcaceae bacterium]|nr:hypothetical protein [Peptococcaceae bacterium]
MQDCTQIVVDIIQRIHDALGLYHVSIKLNNTDIPKEDCRTTCQLLEQADLASVEMEWLYPQLHEAMRQSIHIPIILIGEYRNPAEMEPLMASESIDYLGLSRPLIREVDLPNRWQNGDRCPILCISTKVTLLAQNIWFLIINAKSPLITWYAKLLREILYLFFCNPINLS